MATSTQINSITALYVGYFDRAPDPAGLQFWIDQIDNGREYNTIAADFAASAEAVALYPYLTTPDVSSPAAFITNIYANLFGRTPDDEGRDFWTGVLEDGSVSVADMIEAIIMGARDDATAGTFDKSVLDNKVEVGLDFALETGNVPGFEFDAAAKAAAVAAVNGVTEDEATVAQAKAATDAYVADGTVPGEGIEGETFTLNAATFGTTGTDNVTGTAGNDTIRAVTAGSLNSADMINGGAGADVLNISLNGIAGGAGNNQPIIKNVERINSSDTTALDLSETTGLQQAWAKVADTQSAVFTSAKTDVTFGVEGVLAGETETNSVTFSAGQLTAGNTVKLAVADVAATGSAVFNFTTAQAALIENISVNAAADADGSVTLDGTGDPFNALESLTITGAGDITVTNSGATTLETVDASAATGDVNVTEAGIITADLVATGGSGDDTLSFANATGKLTLNGGAGNDALVGGAGNDKINGGAGADMMTGNAGADAFTVETTTIQDLGFDLIGDFDATETDTISFGGPAGSADNYVEATATGDGFVTARSAAETQLAADSAHQYVVIKEATGLDSYAFYDGNNDGKLDANGIDFAVKLTGVALTDIAFGDIVA